MPPELQMVAGAPVLMFPHNIHVKAAEFVPNLESCWWLRYDVLCPPPSGLEPLSTLFHVPRPRLSWKRLYVAPRVVPCGIAVLRNEIESKSSREYKPSCTCAREVHVGVPFSATQATLHPPLASANVPAVFVDGATQGSRLSPGESEGNQRWSAGGRSPPVLQSPRPFFMGFPPQASGRGVRVAGRCV